MPIDITKSDAGMDWKITLPLTEEDRLQIEAGASMAWLSIHHKVFGKEAAFFRRHLRPQRIQINEASAAAINSLAVIPGLEEMHVTFLGGRGVISAKQGPASFHIHGFYDRKPTSVDADINALSQWPQLSKLSYRYGKLPIKSVRRFGDFEYLESLDLEDTHLSDRKLEALVQGCPLLKKLHVPANPISLKGLRLIVEHLPEMESLDLWGTRLEVSDLQLLSQLKRLSYFSYGSFMRKFDADEFLAIISRIPSLNFILADQVPLSPSQVEELTKLVPSGHWRDEADQSRRWP